MKQKKPRKSINQQPATYDQVVGAISGIYGKGGGKQGGGYVKQHLAMSGFYDQGGGSLVNSLNDGLVKTKKLSQQGFMGVEELAKGTAHVANEAENVHEMFGALPKELRRTNEEMKRTLSGTKEWAVLLGGIARSKKSMAGGSGGKGGGGGGGSGHGGGGGGDDDGGEGGFWSWARKMAHNPLVSFGAGLAASHLGPLGRIGGATAMGGLYGGGTGAAWAAMAATAAESYNQIKQFQDALLPLQMSLGATSKGVTQFTSVMSAVTDASFLNRDEVAKLGYEFLEAGIPIDGTTDGLKDYMIAAGKFSKVTGISTEATAKFIKSLMGLGVSGQQAEESLNGIYRNMQYNHLSITELNASLTASEAIWRKFGSTAAKSRDQLIFDIQGLQGMFKQMNMTPEMAVGAMGAMSEQESKFKMASYMAVRGQGNVQDLFKLAKTNPDEFMQKFLQTQMGQIGTFSGPRKLMMGQPMSNMEEMFASLQMGSMETNADQMFGPEVGNILRSHISNFETGAGKLGEGWAGAGSSFEQAAAAFGQTPLGGKPTRYPNQTNLGESFDIRRRTLTGLSEQAGAAIGAIITDVVQAALGQSDAMGRLDARTGQIPHLEDIHKATGLWGLLPDQVHLGPGVPMAPASPIMNGQRGTIPTSIPFEVPKSSGVAPGKFFVAPPPASFPTGSVLGPQELWSNSPPTFAQAKKVHPYGNLPAPPPMPAPNAELTPVKDLFDPSTGKGPPINSLPNEHGAKIASLMQENNELIKKWLKINERDMAARPNQYPRDNWTGVVG